MSKIGKHQNKGNMYASRATHTSSVLNTNSQSRFTSKRSVTLSEAKLGDGKSTAGPKLGITVYDEDGNDVTPRPLHSFDPAMQKSQLFGSDNQSTVGTPTDLMSFASLYQIGTASAYAQPFSRSIYGSTSNRSARSRRSSIESSGEITESGPEITTGFADVMTVRREEVEDLTDADLNKIVDIILEESDTIWLFDQKGISVSEEGEDAQNIKKKNSLYEELCKTKEGNDRYTDREMQTFNNAQKNKDIQAEKVGLVDVGISVTSWDMFDTYATATTPPVDKNQTQTLGDQSSRPVSTQLEPEESVGTSRVTESRASIMTTSVMGDTEQEFIAASQDVPVTTEVGEDGINPLWEFISNSEPMKQDLVVMERVVTENIYQPKQAAYRGISVLVDPDKVRPESESVTGTTSPEIMTSMGPTLDRLWSYSCSLTKGRNVASMAWNKVNTDILAVGYGQFGFNEQNKSKGGLACCWNLKNPEFPERVFHCKSSVTAIDFSLTNPSLLAVGQYDGTVCIYNVRNPTDEAVLDSFDCQGKHSSPVWQLQWIEREKGVSDDRGEILVSIAADGRIVQWTIRKGFECSDLMKLKRSGKTNLQKKKERAEAFISRQAPGMCFDFHKKDSNVYLAGTEEGLIHKCSCSYNEQFLESYSGHTGPLYKVRWSPFCPDVFLSCSSDWSIRLWTQSELQPVLSFFSTTKVVHDVCWSPYSSSVFCAVNEGAVEIWDLNTNTLDPLISHLASPGIRLSCSIFSKDSNSILVGDSDGQVTIFQLRNMQEYATTQKNNTLIAIVESALSTTTDHKNGDRKKE